MKPLVLAVVVVHAVALSAALAGCTTVNSSAVRTDGVLPQHHLGPVRLYAGPMPAQARVVGLVEVDGVNDEANVEVLLPVFVRRVASLGATGAIIDVLRTRYELRTQYRTETMAMPCGYRATCWTTRIVPYQFVVRTLAIKGRALLPVGPAEGRGGAAP